MNARRGKKREARRIRRGRRRRRDSKFRITPTAATHLFLSLLLRVCVCQMIGSQLTIQEDVAIMYHKSQHTYTHTHTQRNATQQTREKRHVKGGGGGGGGGTVVQSESQANTCSFTLTPSNLGIVQYRTELQPVYIRERHNKRQQQQQQQPILHCTTYDTVYGVRCTVYGLFLDCLVWYDI